MAAGFALPVQVAHFTGVAILEPFLEMNESIGLGRGGNPDERKPQLAGERGQALFNRNAT